MAFDKKLDKELYREEAEFEITKIIVSVHSYNYGDPKLQISRQNRNMESGEFIFSKLGRMTKEEVDKVLPLIQNAKQYMEKDD